MQENQHSPTVEDRNARLQFDDPAAQIGGSDASSASGGRESERNDSPRTFANGSADQGLESILARFQAVRQFSEQLCDSLEVEDFVVQSMPDVSPTRWHLAHTTWFFETFALSKFEPQYDPQDDSYRYLFNSYYNKIGEQFPRAMRGLITRPTVAEVFQYRRAVDEAVANLLSNYRGDDWQSLYQTIDLGLHHEQQHQELMLTDIKHVLSCNPLFPSYRAGDWDSTAARGDVDSPASLHWLAGKSGIQHIGYGEAGFAFDNESPRHEVLLRPHELASRLVTCAEYLEFIEDGGYRRPELWLSLGWQTVQQEGWQAPLYWHRVDGQWQIFTLAGLRELVASEPVVHVSFFEADAYARWCNARLPLESEWEVAGEGLAVAGNFADEGRLHPDAVTERTDASQPQLQQMYGDVWEWTSSPYVAYPGYRIPDGAVGEYNGKFMCNQYVLRGGSCATSQSHIRPSYRNFFPPEARWQFSGIRLARDAGL